MSWLFLFLLPLVGSIPVDNGVEGEPEIECGPTSITVNFNTRNVFQGHVYVKGLFDQTGCRNDEGGRQVTLSSALKLKRTKSPPWNLCFFGENERGRQNPLVILPDIITGS